MNGEELKTIFLEYPNDLRFNDPDVAKELLSYQFCEEDSVDDEVVLAYVLNVLIHNQKLSIKESTEVIQKHIDVSALHKINEPLIQYRLGSTMLKVIRDAIGYETNEEIIETPVAYKQKKRKTILRITKKVGITAAAAAMFTILLLPASGTNQNARDKNLVSYIINSIRQKFEYIDHGADSNGGYMLDEFSLFELNWMLDGFKSYGATIDFQEDYNLMTHIYRKSNQTITFRIMTFKDSGYVSYEEFNGEMTTKTINDVEYNFSSNLEYNQVIWNSNNKSYTLFGNIDMDSIEELIINNFGG